jgi:predicted DNA-binding transcriptional regulator AlpA
MHTNQDHLGDDLALDIDDVVKKTTISRTKVYEEIKLGRLKARKIGRRTIILADDARAWLAASPLMQAGAE